MLPAAEYAYNNSIHVVIRVSYFYTLYSMNPELAWDIEGDTSEGEAPATHKHAKQMITIRELLQKCLWAVVEIQVKYYNKSHIVKTYNIRDIVLLSTKNIRLAHLSKKLDHCFAGPFWVLDLIGKQVYKLDIPKFWKQVHPVFHILLLEPYHSRPEAGQPTVPEPVLLSDGEE